MSGAFDVQIPSTIIVTLDTQNYSLEKDTPFFNGSLLDLACFSLSRVIRRYPKANAQVIDPKWLATPPSVDIGIAMDNGENLKVLTLLEADSLSLSETQEKILELLDLYESGKTIIPRLFQPTIVISDLSGLEVDLAIPTLVANLPMIIAITSPKESLFRFACTYDHRVLDGKIVSNLLSELSSMILGLLRPSEIKQNLSCSACGKTVQEEIELDYRNRGLIVQVNSLGEQVLSCRSCFEGY